MEGGAERVAAMEGRDAWRRVIGSFDRDESGPTVIAIGGLHGNEPAGYLAAAGVLDALKSASPPFRGRFVALGGNLGALRESQRFRDRDLNRGWSDAPPAPGQEEREQTELRRELNRHLEAAPGRAIVIDLHSTSAPGPPFAIMGDTVRNRRIAFALQVPVILGLEELLEGTLIEYLGDHGHVAVAMEGGQHEAPETIDRLETALWLALETAGCLRGEDIPERRARLDVHRTATQGFPAVLEVRYRHAITEDEAFEMRPGFVNLDPIDADQALADDRNGPILSPERGCILLPLYQGKGNDGFFVGRSVRRHWLAIARAMRWLRLDRLAPLLPGVRRDPHHADHLLADPGVARWFTVEIFHLLGYRKEHPRDGLLHFSRRRPDHLPPIPL